MESFSPNRSSCYYEQLILTALFTWAFGIPTLFSTPSQIWEELPPIKEGRAGMVAFTTPDSKPAYFGGTSWEDGIKRFHASGFVLDNGSWKSLEPLADPIAYAAVASKDGLIYAVGGTDGTELHPETLVFKPSPKIVSSDTYRSQYRVYAGAAWLGTALYLLGGSTELSPLNPTASVSKLEMDRWSDVSQLPEGALINPAVATWKTEILVFGGGLPTENGLENTSSVYAFEPAENAWTKHQSLPAPTRGTVALSLPDIGILVAGGYIEEGDFSSNLLLFDPDSDTLETLAQLPVSLMLPALVSDGKWLYLYGGEDAPGRRSNRAFRASITDLLKNRSD